MADDNGDSGDRTGQAFNPTQQSQPQVKDASQPGALRQMWDAWTSRPENNAALINFGLQMMQPIQSGQSALGHFAQSVGAGLEAGGRVGTQEEERAKLEEEQGLKEREESRKERETGAYEQYVQGKGMRKLSPVELEVIAQRNFNKWANTAAPIVGDDNYVTIMNKRHPEAGGKITKADLIDPRSPYGREVKAMMRPQGDQYTGGILGSGTTMDTSSAGSSPDQQYGEGTVISNGTQKMVMKGGKWQPI